MRERALPILKAACLVLGAAVAIQLFGLLREGDPLLGLEGDLLATEKAATSGAEASAGAGKKAGPEKKEAPEGGKKAEEAGKKAEPPPVDPRQRAIERSGIFGAPPRKGGPSRPALLGIAGDCAMLKLPDGKVDLLAEGSEMGGVKVLRIATNRVLVEHNGKQIELTIFSGMGSSPIQENEKDIKGEKEKRP